LKSEFAEDVSDTNLTTFVLQHSSLPIKGVT